MAKTKPAPLLYVGPTSSFSVVKDRPEDAPPITDDRALVTGQTYTDLPLDHPVIGNLIAAKLLITPPDADQPEASSPSAVPESASGKNGGASFQEGNAQ